MQLGMLSDLHLNDAEMRWARLGKQLDQLNCIGVRVLVLLGDLVDGKDEAESLALLRRLSKTLSRFEGEVHVVPGNHDLDHLSKEQFYGVLGIAPQVPRLLDLNGEGALVLLDACFSSAGKAYDHGNVSWKEAAIPREQLVWLSDTLQSVCGPIIVGIHQCLDGSGVHTVKNADAARKILSSSSRVAAVFQGHRHAGSLFELDGVRYCTLAAGKYGAEPVSITIEDGAVLFPTTGS